MTTETEIMAKRTTADGKTVLFWTDGLVTFGMGFAIRSVGVSKNPRERNLNVQAAWLLAGEVALYDACELSRVVKAARMAVRSAVNGAPPLPIFRRAANQEARS